jgi:hypothetical protein
VKKIINLAKGLGQLDRIDLYKIIPNIYGMQVLCWLKPYKFLNPIPLAKASGN